MVNKYLESFYILELWWDQTDMFPELKNDFWSKKWKTENRFQLSNTKLIYLFGKYYFFQNEQYNYSTRFDIPCYFYFRDEWFRFKANIIPYTEIESNQIINNKVSDLRIQDFSKIQSIVKKRIIRNIKYEKISNHLNKKSWL